MTKQIDPRCQNCGQKGKCSACCYIVGTGNCASIKQAECDTSPTGGGIWCGETPGPPPPPPGPPGPSSSPNHTALIIGLVIGGAALVALIIFLRSRK